MVGIVGAVNRLLQLASLYMELRVKNNAYNKIKQVNNEVDELEKNIAKLRNRGKHADADRLLEKYARACSFQQWVSNLEERTELCSTKGLHVGRRGNNSKKGSDDSGLDSGAKG